MKKARPRKGLARKTVGLLSVWLAAEGSGQAGTATTDAWRTLEEAVRTDTSAAMRAAHLYKPDRLITYKQVGDVELRLHAFEPVGHRKADKAPAIVFFFGGGFRVGHPGQFYAHSAYLASRGMVAFSAEYRTESVHGTEPDAAVADARSAIRWLRANAVDLGIDPERIAAGGGSAGGFLAAAAAALSVLDEPGEDLTVSSRPDTLILFNGPLDGSARPDRIRGTDLTWREVSPLHNITAGFPPMAFFTGAEDALIPPSQIDAIRDAMAAAGSRLDLFVYPGQKHGFFNFDRGGGVYYRITLREADRFLESLGWLSGPPTLEDP